VRSSRRMFLFIVLALFCAPLVAHVYLGSYSRFLADDFCSSAIARSRGIFRGTLYWYTIWTGRFSANFLDSLFGYAGPAVTPYTTGLVVVLWFIAIVIAVRQLANRDVPLIQSGIVAAMVLFVTLHVIPQVGQSLYWGQGMRSVVPPLILGTAYIAWIANRTQLDRKLGSLTLPAVGVLTFVAVAFAETYFVVQIAAIVFALVIPVIFKRYVVRTGKNYFAMLTAGLAGSLAGGLLMIVAPGNKIRQSSFPPPPALPHLLSISFRGLREFFELVVLAPDKWFVWIGLVLCSFIFGLQVFQQREQSPARPPALTLIWLPVVGFVLLLACWMPMAWGTSLTLAHRTFIIPAYLLVCLATCWAYIAGRLCRRLYVPVQAVVTTLSMIGLLAFGMVAAHITRKMWQRRTTFAEYARSWDERDQLIQHAKSQGQSYAVVRGLHNWAELDEIAVDPKITWLTKCVQQFYGIGVIPDLGDLNGEPDGPARQAALERQFDSIPKLPGSIPTELNQIYKTERGKVGFYKSESTPDQIKAFYKNELARLGWKFVGEKEVEPAQGYSGRTHSLFCNGETAATLFITAQDEARLGYTYSLALNWGMSSGYTWGVVDCPISHS
jgi:hypothetical protein